MAAAIGQEGWHVAIVDEVVFGGPYGSEAQPFGFSGEIECFPVEIGPRARVIGGQLARDEAVADLHQVWRCWRARSGSLTATAYSRPSAQEFNRYMASMFTPLSASDLVISARERWPGR